MKSIEKLMYEHENILILGEILSSACKRILQSDELIIEDWEKIIKFSRIYADKLHHQKEENILFDEMVRTLGETAKKLIINGMLVEHDLNRLYIMQLETAITQIKIDPANANLKIDIIGNAVAYRDLLIRHIAKENDVLFKFAENNFTQESIEKVEKLSNEEELKTDVLAMKKEQVDILDKLKSIYL